MSEALRLASLADHAAYLEDTAVLRQYKGKLLERLLDGSREPETLPGFSFPAGRMVDFLLDKTLLRTDGEYNLRETVNCPETYFNMRMRAVIHAVTEYETDMDLDGYICEQKTPLYQYFRNLYPNMVGSEYLGDSVPLGECDADGLRNEDSTQLTFDDASFDFELSFEVLEHIPDFLLAFREARRVLRPGGRFYFTAPFIPHRTEHLIRARMDGGEVVHILEPEWHGDPVTGEGILCFQHFGWSIIDEIKDSGFSSVEALIFDQPEYGYYTKDPIFVFKAIA